MRRKRGEHLQHGETKRTIIEYILSIPDSIADEPDMRQFLRDKYDIREPKSIKILLNDVLQKKCITKEEKRGFSNKWSISENNLENIYHEFKDLLSILQKNEKILLMIVGKHFEQKHAKEWVEVLRIIEECRTCLKFPQKPDGIDCSLSEAERKNCFNTQKNKDPISLENSLDNLSPRVNAKIDDYQKKIEISQKEFQNKFKEWLMISPCLFKLCLSNTPEKLENKFRKILKLSMEEHVQGEDVLTLFILSEEGILAYFDKIFEICVNMDIMNDEVNEKAIEYVYKINRSHPDHQKM
jgi:hypothetical protein